MPRPSRRLLLSAVLGVVIAAIGGLVSALNDDAPASLAAQQIPSDCIPPEFGDPPIIRPIDRATTGCDLDGEPTATDPTDQAKHEAQNRAKNAFCAWRNTDPALVTRVSFDRLMTNLPANFPWGSRTRMPTAAERATIRAIYTTSEGDTIGEGSYVQFVAYLLEGHFTGAESVNCGKTQRQDIDIHLALVTERPWTLNLTNRGPVECASVTAEISPHHRPIDWDLLGRMTGTPAAQKLVKGQQKLVDEDLQRPLRIRGHLFFDASHGLCSGNEATTGNPPRRSGWEIHPVYSIDVCEFRTLTTCKADREDVWTPLADWLLEETPS